MDSMDEMTEETVDTSQTEYIDSDMAETEPPLDPLPNHVTESSSNVIAEQELSDFSLASDPFAGDQPGYHNRDTRDSTAEASLEEIEMNAENPTEFETKRSRAVEQRFVAAQMERDRQMARSRKNTMQREQAANWARVRTAFANQSTIYNAEIVGAESVQTTNPDGTIISVPMARCKIFGFFAYIPMIELWTHLPSALQIRASDTVESYTRHALSFINNMSGNKDVMVVITQAKYDPDSERPFGIIASRRRAILRYTNSCYQAPDDDDPRSIQPTQVGDEVTATVNYVYGQNVSLNIRGVDVNVPYFLLTNRYVELVRDLYKPGQKIRVRIDEINWHKGDSSFCHLLTDYRELQEKLKTLKRGTKNYEAVSQSLSRDRLYWIPELQVNGRDSEAADLFELYGAEVRRGSRYRGIVTNIYYNEKNEKTYLRLWLESMQLAALSSNILYGSAVSSPAVGDMVEFEMSIVGNNGILIGRITRKL